MAKKQPMYGSEASISDAVADCKVDYAKADLDDAGSIDGTEIAAALNVEFAKVNKIIAALENFGILKT